LCSGLVLKDTRLLRRYRLQSRLQRLFTLLTHLLRHIHSNRRIPQTRGNQALCIGPEILLRLLANPLCGRFS
jgi:hypothetical protein